MSTNQEYSRLLIEWAKEEIHTDNQRDIAKYLGVSQPMISQVLNTNKIFKSETFRRLAEQHELSLTAFLARLMKHKQPNQYTYKYPMAVVTGDAIVYRCVEPCGCNRGKVLAPWGDRPPMDLVDCSTCQGTGWKVSDAFNEEDGKIQVLLVKRAVEPFIDCWAIPGGHFNPQTTDHVKADESVLDCVVRELEEETGIVVDPYECAFVGYFDAIGRDPRGRYITFAYFVECPEGAKVEAKDDAKEFQWIDLDDVQNGKVDMSFDHRKILLHAARLIYDEYGA